MELLLGQSNWLLNEAERSSVVVGLTAPCLKLKLVKSSSIVPKFKFPTF